MGKHHRRDDEDFTPEWPKLDPDEVKIPPIIPIKPDRIGEASRGRDSAPEYT